MENIKTCSSAFLGEKEDWFRKEEISELAHLWEVGKGKGSKIQPNRLATEGSEALSNGKE